MGRYGNCWSVGRRSSAGCGSDRFHVTLAAGVRGSGDRDRGGSGCGRVLVDLGDNNVDTK